MHVEPRIVSVELPRSERPPTGERLVDVRRLAIARTDRLGDLVVSLPAVAAIRAAYPGARLALAVRPRWRELASMVEGVDEVITIDALRSFDPQAIVCISREASLAWAARRAGIGARIGTARRAWSWLFTRRVDGSRRGGRSHETDHALEFARRVGARVPAGAPAYGLTPSAETLDRAARWCDAHGVEPGFVLVHPGSGGSCPRWPAARFVELVRRLTTSGRRVIVSIGPDDAALAAAFDDLPRGATRFDGGLVELIGLAAAAACAVGNSSGPLHLAAALGTPALTIHAPWPSCDAVRWGPYAANGLAVVAHSDQAARWTRAERRRGADELMGGLDPGDVLEAFERLR